MDGQSFANTDMTWTGGNWSVDVEFTPFEPPKALYGGVGQVVGNVNIIILARSGEQVTGKLVMVPQ